jgi:beta-lactamase class A
MDRIRTRRTWLGWGTACAAGLAAGFTAERARAAPESAPRGHAERLQQLEKQSGGRLGIAVLDTQSGQRFGQRAEERFPMCSTFKLLAVAAVLWTAGRSGWSGA